MTNEDRFLDTFFTFALVVKGDINSINALKKHISDELYDMKSDPDELSNILETYPEKAEELGIILDKWLNSFERYGYRQLKLT